MKSKLLAIFCFLVVISPTIALAQGAAGGPAPTTDPEQGLWESLTEIPPFQQLVGIPGISLNGDDIDDQDFGSYINALYRLSISLAALLAVIKIVVAGAKYMLDDIVTHKSEAKAEIKGALIGLLVIIGAVVILNTVNTDLTQNTLMIDDVGIDSQATMDAALADVVAAIQRANDLCDQPPEGMVCRIDTSGIKNLEDECKELDGIYQPGSTLRWQFGGNYVDKCTYLVEETFVDSGVCTTAGACSELLCTPNGTGVGDWSKEYPGDQTLTACNARCTNLQGVLEVDSGNFPISCTVRNSVIEEMRAQEVASIAGCADNTEYTCVSGPVCDTFTDILGTCQRRCSELMNDNNAEYDNVSNRCFIKQQKVPTGTSQLTPNPNVTYTINDGAFTATNGEVMAAGPNNGKTFTFVEPVVVIENQVRVRISGSLVESMLGCRLISPSIC